MRKRISEESAPFSGDCSALSGESVVIRVRDRRGVMRDQAEPAALGWLALVFDSGIGAWRFGIVVDVACGFVEAVRLDDGAVVHSDGTYPTATVSPDTIMCTAEDAMRAVGGDTYACPGRAAHALSPLRRVPESVIQERVHG